ncbi:MAG: hypothetical protein KBF68_03430 [Nitrosomonas sp.]|nr:hypothetical protein [Nitrosomonas sp.]
MEKDNKKESLNTKTGRFSMLSAPNGTLRELKESTAKLKREVKKESNIFSNYSLADGGKKIS